VKDKLEKEKDWSIRRDKESRPILNRPDKDNSLKSKAVWLNKQESKERIIWTKFKNRNKLKCKKEKSKKRKDKPWLITHRRSEARSTPMSNLKSKTDLIILRRVERLEKELTMKDQKLLIYKTQRLMSLNLLALIANTYMSSRRKLFHSESLFWINTI